MLRAILESTTGPMTDLEFRQVLDLATTDIRVNRVGFSKRTSIADVVKIAEISLKVLRRAQAA